MYLQVGFVVSDCAFNISQSYAWFITYSGDLLALLAMPWQVRSLAMIEHALTKSVLQAAAYRASLDVRPVALEPKRWLTFCPQWHVDVPSLTLLRMANINGV